MNINVGMAVWAVFVTMLFLRMVVAEPRFTNARKRGCVPFMMRSLESSRRRNWKSLGSLRAIQSPDTK